MMCILINNTLCTVKVYNALIHAEPPSTSSGHKGNPQGQLVFTAMVIQYYHANILFI